MMTASEALILSRGFPKDKNVPKQIFIAMEQAEGEEKKKFGQIIEGLYIDCKSDEDYDLIDRFFGN
tara:strand:- start:41 stop:238 length:198 start_codon:yes stop_codon:yes gene_type:complete